MSSTLAEHVQHAEFEAAVKECRNLDSGSIRDILLSTAYDTGSICPYCFCAYMCSCSDSEWWHTMSIDLLIHPLCFIEGAYAIALFHAKELLKTRRSPENLERILFFYHIPERLVNSSDAKKIAYELLAYEPENSLALNVINSV